MLIVWLMCHYSLSDDAQRASVALDKCRAQSTSKHVDKLELEVKIKLIDVTTPGIQIITENWLEVL